MSLLVDLQPVPNRVFELVKQRIMANRARLLKKEDENLVKAASRRPRPQRARFGARMDHYARPEPAAIKSDDPAIGSVWAWWDALSPSNNGTWAASKLLLYPPGVKVTGPNFSSKLNYATTNLESDQYKVVDFGARDFPSVEHLRPPIVSYGGPYNSKYTAWEGKHSLYSVNTVNNTWTFQKWEPVLFDLAGSGEQLGYTFVTVPLNTLPEPSSHTDASYWFYINQDQVSYKNILMLPVGDNTNIVIVVAREVKASHVHMINYTDTWQGNIGVNPTNNQPTHYYTGQVQAFIGPTYSVASDALFSNYYFIVSEKKIRQINPPQAIEALINKLYPDPSLGTAQYSSFTSGVSHGAGYSYGPGGNIENGQFLTPQIPKINYDAYFGHSPYEDDLRGEYNGLNEETRIFARHFGMGNYVRPYHASITYFTPAIYTWLKGEMGLSHDGPGNLAYAGFRRDFFANAPSLYIDPTVGESSAVWDNTDRAGITRQVPVRVDQAMPFAAFTQRKKLPNSEATYISWDWGNKSYCRQQALDLGFAEADLTP